MTTNLQSLVWVQDDQARRDDSYEVAYALDALYVYRRLIDPTEPVPRPRYCRACHRDVLRTAGNWSDVDESLWEPVTETGSPVCDET